MQNQLHRHYSLLLGLQTPWKVANVDLQIEASKVVIQVEHNGAQEPCIECAKSCNIRDHAAVREWRHLDSMNFKTVIKARTPRTNCAECGVKTVAVPWAEKSSRFTLMFEAFAIAVFEAARSLEAGRQLLGLSWDCANTIISRAVERGLAQRDISEVTRVGIDEKSFLRGHNYITLLNDIDEGRVLDVVPERTEKACRGLRRQANNRSVRSKRRSYNGSAVGLSKSVRADRLLFGVSNRSARRISLLTSGHFQSVRAVTPLASIAITQHP